jgi:hypothetical protein
MRLGNWGGAGELDPGRVFAARQNGHRDDLLSGVARVQVPQSTTGLYRQGFDQPKPDDLQRRGRPHLPLAHLSVATLTTPTALVALNPARASDSAAGELQLLDRRDADGN